MQNKFNNLNNWASDSSNLIFDCRSLQSFSDGFIAGSIFGGNNQFNFQHISRIFSTQCNVLVVLDDLKHESLIREKLTLAGFNNIEGFILFDREGLKADDTLLDLIILISPEELALDIPHDPNLMLVDVREVVEFEEIHFADTHSSPLSEMGDTANIAMLPEETNLYLFCTDGERSMTAASILRRHGMHNQRVVEAVWDELLEVKLLEVEKTKDVNLN
jgi:hydroxyacylglutathione hydrolase